MEMLRNSIRPEELDKVAGKLKDDHLQPLDADVFEVGKAEADGRNRHERRAAQRLAAALAER